MGQLTPPPCVASAQNNRGEHGGAIALQQGASAVLTHSALTGNLAGASGGALHVNDGNAVLTYCNVTSNAIRDYFARSQLDALTQATFVGSQGGSVVVGSASRVELTHCRLHGMRRRPDRFTAVPNLRPSAQAQEFGQTVRADVENGGLIHCSGLQARLVVRSTTLTGGNAVAYGGAINAERGCAATLLQSRIEGSGAAYGGALYVASSAARAILTDVQVCMGVCCCRCRESVVGNLHSWLLLLQFAGNIGLVGGAVYSAMQAEDDADSGGDGAYYDDLYVDYYGYDTPLQDTKQVVFIGNATSFYNCSAHLAGGAVYWALAAPHGTDNAAITSLLPLPAVHGIAARPR